MIRRSPLRRKRSKPRRSSRVRDEAYLAWVRTQPCAARSAQLGEECRGKTEAHHAGSRGLGQKCSDDEAIPLCTRHHREWHDGNGRFAGMDKAGRSMFSVVAIELTRQAFGDHRSREAQLEEAGL